MTRQKRFRGRFQDFTTKEKVNSIIKLIVNTYGRKASDVVPVSDKDETQRNMSIRDLIKDTMKQMKYCYITNSKSYKFCTETFYADNGSYYRIYLEIDATTVYQGALYYKSFTKDKVFLEHVDFNQAEHDDLPLVLLTEEDSKNCTYKSVQYVKDCINELDFSTIEPDPTSDIFDDGDFFEPINKVYNKRHIDDPDRSAAGTVKILNIEPILSAEEQFNINSQKLKKSIQDLRSYLKNHDPTKLKPLSVKELTKCLTAEINQHVHDVHVLNVKKSKILN
jgi:hypothetical protein